MLDYRKLDLKSLNQLFYLYSLTSFYKDRHYNYIMPLSDQMYNDIKQLVLYDKYFREQYTRWQYKSNGINKKKRRVINKVKFLLEKDCIFLTLTFKSDILTKYSNDKLRELVSRYLKNFNTDYIANVDFGSQFGRIHFHAILQISEIDLSSWKYGFIYAEKINNSNPHCLGKYITKLSFHAFKDTTKDMRVIYPRKTTKVCSSSKKVDLQFEYDTICDAYNIKQI